MAEQMPAGSESSPLSDRVRSVWQAHFDGVMNDTDFAGAIVDLVYDLLNRYIHNQLHMLRVQSMDEDELFNEAIVRLVEHPPKDRETPIIAWLRTAAKNQIFDRLREAKHEPARLYAGDDHLTPTVDHPANDWRWTMKRTVDEEIDALPEDCAYIASMRYIDGHTQQEIALTIGLSRQRVGQYLARAREHLRKSIRLKELMLKKGERQEVTSNAE